MAEEAAEDAGGSSCRSSEAVLVRRRRWEEGLGETVSGSIAKRDRSSRDVQGPKALLGGWFVGCCDIVGGLLASTEEIVRGGGRERRRKKVQLCLDDDETVVNTD